MEADVVPHRTAGRLHTRRLRTILNVNRVVEKHILDEVSLLTHHRQTALPRPSVREVVASPASCSPSRRTAKGCLLRLVISISASRQLIAWQGRTTSSVRPRLLRRLPLISLSGGARGGLRRIAGSAASRRAELDSASVVHRRRDRPGRPRRGPYACARQCVHRYALRRPHHHLLARSARRPVLRSRRRDAHLSACSTTTRARRVEASRIRQRPRNQTIGTTQQRCRHQASWRAPGPAPAAVPTPPSPRDPYVFHSPAGWCPTADFVTPARRCPR